MKTLSIVAITAFAFVGSANFASAQFEVSSDTFQNNSLLPIGVIDNRTFTTPNGTPGNECAPDYERGANQSPQLSWTNVPFYAKYFAVIAFDKTAEVYHWGMYNIPLSTRNLAENAGRADSTFKQVQNYSGNLGYIGPCPPAKDPRGDPHVYQFTVYALRRSITQAELPANSDAEALVLVLTTPRLVIERASIIGTWSSTPPPTQ
jgi:Raf kinase inhibitor-like YbhB/YbcL family protein